MTSFNESVLESEPLLSSGSEVRRDSGHSPSRDQDARASESSDITKSLVLPSDEWPHPGQTNILFRIAAAMFSFIVLGMMVSTLGVMVPQFETYYGLSDFQVSFIFLVWPIGYLVAAYLNGVIHINFGQRGIATAGPLFHIIFTAIAVLHPPFPILLIALTVGSLGTGILDGSFCAWAGGMGNANVVQGFLHGSYSAGAAIGPLIAGTMLSVGNNPWYEWYYVLVRRLDLPFIGPSLTLETYLAWRLCS